MCVEISFPARSSQAIGTAQGVRIIGSTSFEILVVTVPDFIE